MAKAKVTSATSTGNVAFTEADYPSRHSRILASAGVHKEAFYLSAIFITLDRNGYEIQTALNREQVQADPPWIGYKCYFYKTVTSPVIRSLLFSQRPDFRECQCAQRTTKKQPSGLLSNFLSTYKGLFDRSRLFVAPPDNNLFSSWSSPLLGIPWLTRSMHPFEFGNLPLLLETKTLESPPGTLLKQRN